MKTIRTLAAALSLVATAAAGQQLEQWCTAGGWDVMIDPTLGDGCLIQAEYEDGSLVRIGFDRNAGMGYIAAFNYDWGDIEEGAEYEIEFDLDGEVFTGVATGLYLDDVPGADIYFDNPDFLFAIAERYTLTLYNSNGPVMAIDLDGTYVGLEAVIQCQEEMG